MSPRPILIMAGGTGGHVYPALAIAQELTARSQPVVWLGARGGMEARVTASHDLTMDALDVSALRGRGALNWVIGPLKAMRAVWQALAIIRRRNPCVVLGMGGFVSGPGGLAAWLTRRPLIVHEQNAVAGLTNRLLARFARVVLCAFPGSFSASKKARVVGNPVRNDIASLPAPALRFANRNGPLRLLVLGGSLGAKSLNEQVPAMLASLAADQLPEVWHQCGERTEEACRAAYRTHGVQARISAFIDDMPDAYGWADLVICRAGALTLAELAAAGLAAVLVPYPYAVDDHQTANAQVLVDAGAAICIGDDLLSAETLREGLTTLGRNRESLQKRAEQALRAHNPQAVTDIADTCIAFAEVGS